MESKRNTAADETIDRIKKKKKQQRPRMAKSQKIIHENRVEIKAEHFHIIIY